MFRQNFWKFQRDQVCAGSGFRFQNGPSGALEDAIRSVLFSVDRLLSTNKMLHCILKIALFFVVKELPGAIFELFWAEQLLKQVLEKLGGEIST